MGTESRTGEEGEGEEKKGEKKKKIWGVIFARFYAVSVVFGCSYTTLRCYAAVLHCF